MADHGLDGSTPSHLAADRFGDMADLAGDPDFEPVGIVAIASVAENAANHNPGELFEISDDGTERVAVIRISVQRLEMRHALAALGRGDRRGNRDLAAELIWSPRLAAADALHLRACNE